jgi:hypothetical protein
MKTTKDKWTTLLNEMMWEKHYNWNDVTEDVFAQALYAVKKWVRENLKYIVSLKAQSAIKIYLFEENDVVDLNGELIWIAGDARKDMTANHGFYISKDMGRFILIALYRKELDNGQH